MRLLVLNPNTTESITALLCQAGRLAAATDTELIPLTATRGVPYISSRAEAQIGGAIALEMLAEQQRDADAAIIAAFGDPGLFAARELFDIPVVGMSEAAMLTARMLGHRFAIITFTREMIGWYRDCVDMHGMERYCVALRAIDESFASVATVQEEKQEQLVELANRAAIENDAEVIILAGAPLAGLGQKIRDRVPVPVVDPIAAAVKQTEALVSLQFRKTPSSGIRRRVAKPTIRLQEALAATIEQRDVDPVQGGLPRKRTSPV